MPSDPHGRYFTDLAVSAATVAFIDVPSPSTVLDLACGDGSLSAAAHARWQTAKVVGVDIHPPKSAPVGRFILDDALSEAIGRRIGRPPEVAVCNPPFTHPEWKSRHSQLLREVGLKESDAAIREAGAVSLFLAQNIRLLAPDGQLAIIVPDTVIAGERTRALRRWLLSSFQVHEVVQLPRTFHGTEAQTHLIRLSKTPPKKTHKIAVTRLNADGQTSPFVTVNANTSDRLDYEYVRSRSFGSTIRALGGELERGTLNSRQVREAKVPVFHTSSFVAGKSSISLPCPQKNEHHAKTGDILVGRVGRNAEKKVALVARGSGDFSDCVFRLRLPISYRRLVLDYLTSPIGQAALKGALRGVAARYLTAEALLDMQIPTEAMP